MQETDDNELLRRYADHNSEEAFATLVTRHLNLVYSIALRHVRDPHHAEEITQAVFVILARKAGHLRRGVVISGWLYHAARLTAANFLRSETQRARREQEAHMQSILNESEPDVWPQLAPILDAAMAGLGERDRDAVVLRFFEGKKMNEVGVALGVNEEAAKKRVNRAVEKLRLFFTKRGVVLPAAILTAAISAKSVQAAPVALAKTVTAVAMTQGIATSGSTLTLIKGTLKVMARTKAKTAALVGLSVAVAVGTAALVVKAVPHGSDLTELQGTWSGHENGAQGTSSMVLQGTNLTFHGANPNEWYKGTFSLKETTNPKQFVTTITDCPAPQYVGKVGHSIYKIESNTLTISGNEPGDPEIPTSFDAQGGSRVFVFTKDAEK